MYLNPRDRLDPHFGHAAHVNGDGLSPSMSPAGSSTGPFFPSVVVPPDPSDHYALDERRLIGLNELAAAAMETERLPLIPVQTLKVPQASFPHPLPALAVAQEYPTTSNTSPVLSLNLVKHSIEEASPIPVPSHPTTNSTSSDEPSSKPHDIFSNYDTDDTVTDPDLEASRRLEQQVAVPTAPIAVLKPPSLTPDQPKHQVDEVASNDRLGVVSARSTPQMQAEVKKAPVRELSIGVSLVEVAVNEVVQDASTPKTSQKLQERCSKPGCPPEVPSVLLTILDNPSSADGILAKQYASCARELCLVHLQKFAELMATIAQTSTTPVAGDHQGQLMHQTGIGTRWKLLPRGFRRRTSLSRSPTPNDSSPPFKRPRLDRSPSSLSNPVMVKEGGRRPTPDIAHDEAYRQKMLAELGQRFTKKGEEELSRGELTNRLIHEILTKIKSPNADPRNGPVDAGMMTGPEAASVLNKGILDVPIFTQGQQQFQWSNTDRPISELFRRMEDLGRTVSVQIPSIHWDSPSAERRTLIDVQQRFLEHKSSEDPWNILDLRSPLPPSVLPSFLTGENCQLLPRMRDALLMGNCAERTKAMRQEWNEWTELLEWVLLSEGGHNTAPHMDSHGWATWITVQEGLFGFGWMARPTEAEQAAWMADPIHYTGGNWRFLILKPGQTVFFPTGTIHFVFRLRSEQTLAVGGHVLQWSGIERWIMVILNQLKNPSITNEDLGVDVLKYVRTVASLVTNRLKQCRLGELGTIETAQRFLVLTNEVERHFQRKKKKKSKR